MDSFEFDPATGNEMKKRYDDCPRLDPVTLDLLLASLFES